MTTTLRHGSLFSGYGGLDLAVEETFREIADVRTVWHADICRDPSDGKGAHTTPHGSPCAILAHRYPGIPNLGDVSAVDWNQVEPVEILSGGFPCQDVSHAGKRAGLRPGTRSGLWEHFAYAIATLRPRIVAVENVRGLLSAQAHSNVEPCPWCVGDPGAEPPMRALGAVAADLADLGYDSEWRGVRASDVGAPHGRFRVFLLAWPATPDDADLERRG